MPMPTSGVPLSKRRKKHPLRSWLPIMAFALFVAALYAAF